MLLAIDVGNTNITCAVIQKEEFLTTFRMTTKLPRTSDEFGMMICDLLKYKGIDEKEIEETLRKVAELKAANTEEDSSEENTDETSESSNETQEEQNETCEENFNEENKQTTDCEQQVVNE